MNSRLPIDCAFWESYAQALIGAIKRYDGGVSITTVIEMNFFNTAGEKIVTHESPTAYPRDQYLVHYSF